MKRLFFLMLLSCLASVFFSANAMAVESGTCGAEGDGSNLTWVLDEAGVLSVDGTGRMQDYSDDGLTPPWNPDLVKGVRFGSGVTSIGNYAFANTKVSELSIPSNIEEVGMYAFTWCDELSKVDVAAKILRKSAFHYCGDSFSVTLREGVTRIESQALYSVEGNIILPNSLLHIDRDAFDKNFLGRNYLTSIEIGQNNTSYVSVDGVLYSKDMSELVIFPSEKDGDFKIPDGVETFEATFYGIHLSSITVPSSISKLRLDNWRASFETRPVEERFNVYYEGSREQWDEIELLSMYGTDYWADEFNIHFNPGESKYTVVVNGGTGSGHYLPGSQVVIAASIPESGKWFRFKTWSGSENLNFISGNTTTSSATFIMPARDVTLTATFDEGFFSEPIYTAPTFEDYIGATSALIHEYQYVEETSSPNDEYLTGRLIVDANVELPDLERFNVAQIVVDSNHDYLIQFYTADEARACADYLKTLSNVNFVEPDSKISKISTHITVLPRALTTSSNSWGVSAIGADRFSEQLRDKGIVSSVVVAVVDTGVDSSHPFLENRVLPGFDIVDNDSEPNDGDGHGTHVSGTVVDCTPGLNIKVLPVRVLDDNGSGYYAWIGEGIRYAVEHGANVINMSLGGPGESENIEKWVNYAVAHNVTVVVAAGNESSDTEHFIPAGYRNCITVAAVDSSMNRASFSNYGESVDIAAPGVSVKSCIPGNRYDTWNGTSMASPHAAAAAALLLYENNNQTPAQIESRLRSMATDLGEAGWDRYYGAGFLNLSNAEPIGNTPDTPNTPETPNIPDTPNTPDTPDNQIHFSDVPEDAYYYRAVMWAIREGITNGTTSTTFSPNETCTTAQILTFLWRAGGSPEPSTGSNTGLSVQSPFFKAVAWANENGIRGAFSTNSPSSACTRSAAMTYMWNDAGKPAAGENPFTDVDNDSGYATAISWGVNRGITNGTTATTFSPDRSCTRAHIITFLYRYYVESVLEN